MARWSCGASEIEKLIAGGELETLTESAAMGSALLTKANATLATARRIIESDPSSALVLACDAARSAAMALLAQQGLRPTSKGGHYADERVLRAQFGDKFREFGALRRLRHEWEYLRLSEYQAIREEAARSAAAAHEIIQASEDLIGDMDLFDPQ